MKRILCISDSLGLPRPDVRYEDTWFYKISKRFSSFDFVSYFRRKATTEILSCDGTYGDTLLHYLPQIVILQLGICDCAPRYLRTTSLLYKVLTKTPSKIANPLWILIKKIKGRQLNCTDVSIIKFKENLLAYIEKCKQYAVEKIIIIDIAIPGEIMINNNPKITESIKAYNLVYKDICSLYPDYVIVISPITVIDNSLFVDDGYHTNRKGHDLITDRLINVLECV